MILSTAHVSLELLHTFRIARSADDVRESLLLSLRDGDLAGLGEAAPMARYGQTADSAARALETTTESLRNSKGKLDRDRISEIIAPLGEALAGEKAALAAVDIALWDLMGKQTGLPIHEILGLEPSNTPLTSYTIGIDSPRVIRKKVKEAESFPILKVKMGLENDYEIMEQIRGLTNRTVRVDANEGWTKEEALDKIRWLEGQNVEFIEQPLPADRLDEIKWLAEKVSLPFFADESIETIDDIPRLKGAFSGINIKLMKCGGITEALRLIESAREQGMMIMLGCTIESSIGITAAAQISPLVDYADLDGNILIGNDPAAGVTVERGKLVLPEGPGLGVELRDDYIMEQLEIS
jgi:L-alanine-DL-glutamate epimerase-like enolase superfamily enzyme